uniref:Elongator complex protein 5 n=1 Tax=Moniliophthora roreri TaxID=221103 RepID=A0A0W0G2K7_MONRR
MSLRFPDLHDQRNQHFVLLQSSIAQSSLPILRSLLAKRPNQTSSKLVLFCFLHPPLNLVDEALVKSDNVVIYDFLDSIPDYNDHWKDPREQMLDVVKNDSTTLDVVIDSVDTLLSDIGSTPETYSFMVSLLSLISSRSKTSRLILTAHPHALITYLAKEYFTFPPPISAAPKFWGVFIPVSEREHETERLVFQGSGSGDTKEMIIEMILRGGSDASGRRKGVERVLEGWDLQNGCAVELSRLSSLSDLWKKKIVEEAAPDPMQNISFNLQLTPSQQEARARVPLPYVLEGRSSSQPAPSSGAILYDPDSADDIDDDDPDEDLDI